MLTITGIIIGLLGREPEDDTGKFYVEDVCFLELHEQTPRPMIDEDK